MLDNKLIKKVKAEVVPPKKARSLPLTTVGHCRGELATVYRLAKAGDLELSDATKFTYILVALGKMIEANELETRISQIEAQLSGGVRP
ncbi:MAG: hypothetical protein WCK54_18330 [Desulfuromonadales bacterium]